MTLPATPTNGLQRRRALGWMGAPALALAARASAQGAGAATPAARVKGPPVLGELDQQDLDEAFDIPRSAPNLRQVIGRYASQSAAARRRLGEPRRLRYGPSEHEWLDWYATGRPRAPIQFFIHGGVFNRGAARDYAFAAELFVQAGAHLVLPDFAPARELDGRIERQVEQLRRALAWVQREAAALGGDPARIHLGGHSSGAELAAMLLLPDVAADPSWPPVAVKGALCCSATYDMAAFRRSATGAAFRFSDDSERALSVLRHVPQVRVPVIVAVGSLETAHFQRQSQAFASALAAAGRPAPLLVGEGYNHFEVIETLANPYGLLGRAVLEQMQLGPG